MDAIPDLPDRVIKPTHIRPPRLLQGLGFDFAEVWVYRQLIWTLLVRELKARHRMTALGPLWFLLTPFMQMIVFTVVFGNMLSIDSEGVPYPIFLYAALLPWTFFAGVVNQTTMSLPTFLPWMSKVYFPRMIAPIVFVLAFCVDWLISLTILAGLMLYYSVPLTAAVLWFPLYLLMATLAGLAVGMFTGPMSVWFRDTHRFCQYLLHTWYWLSGVVYSNKAFTGNWELVAKLNPMYWVIEGSRYSLLAPYTTAERTIGVAPSVEMLAPLLIFGGICVVGVVFFNRSVKNIGDMA